MLQLAGCGFGYRHLDSACDGQYRKRPPPVVAADDRASAAGGRVRHLRVAARQDLQGVHANRQRLVRQEPREAADLPLARHAERDAELERAELAALKGVAVPVLAPAAAVASVVRQKLLLLHAASRGHVVRRRAAPHAFAAYRDRARRRLAVHGEIRGDVGIAVDVKPDGHFRFAVALVAAGGVGVPRTPQAARIERIFVRLGVRSGFGIVVESRTVGVVSAAVGDAGVQEREVAAVRRGHGERRTSAQNGLRKRRKVDLRKRVHARRVHQERAVALEPELSAVRR